MKVVKSLVVLAVVLVCFVLFITRSYPVHSVVTSFFRKIYQNIDFIDIEGNDAIATEKIISAMYTVDETDKMLLKTKVEIIEALKLFPLIESVSIKYTLPSRLLIIVKERKPLLFYQTQYQVPVIVDTNFNEFTDDTYPLEKLIFVRGKYEKDTVRKFVNFMRQFPMIYENLTEIEFFFGYRFNIVLNNRIYVLFPEGDIENEVQMLLKFITNYNLLQSNVYRVDFRNRQKVFFASDAKSLRYKPEVNRFVLYSQPEKESVYQKIIENAMSKM